MNGSCRQQVRRFSIVAAVPAALILLTVALIGAITSSDPTQHTFTVALSGKGKKTKKK
jgi:hypothetical protein